MEVSVIVPSYNGAHKLPGIIKALQNQNCQGFEVIVVLDGSTDNSVAVLKSLKPGFSSFKIIEQENKGRAAVRNNGAQVAGGDLLLFFDDDMIPLPDCIEQHVQHHKRFPGTILTGGLSEEVTEESSDILAYKSFLSNKWTNNLCRTKEGRLSRESIFITAANFSISKKLFFQLGGFDEQLKDAEDFEFSIRAYKSGVSLYFNPDAFAWHNDKITCASYIRRQRQYIIAHEKLDELKPWIKYEGFRTPVTTPKGFRKNIYMFFANSTWITAVDKEWLTIFPKKVRYKIYDLVIAANGIYFPEKVNLS